MSIDDYRISPELPAAYDRSLADPGRERVIFSEGHFAQAADLNEALSLERQARTRLGNMVARDGDRVENAVALVDTDAGTVTLAEGRLFVRGDVRPVGAAVLADVPMLGDVQIGVRLASAIVTHEDDASLLGLHPGSLAEGEPGAARETVSLSWGFSGDGEAGALTQVYLLRNGTIVDQTPPPGLTPIQDLLASMDSDAHGNYVVRGCRVTALGESGGNQVFSVEEGVANILGRKRTRYASTRHSEPETPDLLAISSEPQTFNTDAAPDTARLFLNRAPINSVSQVTVRRLAQRPTGSGGWLPNSPNCRVSTFPALASASPAHSISPAWSTARGQNLMSWRAGLVRFSRPRS